MKIEQMKLDALIPYARNARTHSEEQVAQIAGSTLMAAERTGRRGFGMELSPIYCDVIVRRWQQYTGKQAVHAVTGKSFDDTATVDAE